ncbi:MAG TPA: cupin domain-containing protein [Solirubrobacteraceae bacterium]|nr:cupin domain-containing protein [Solirubrobacteraceae bacterium]
MEHWDLTAVDVEPHRPQVLHSVRGDARSILLHLPAGEALQDHEVHERAHLAVIDGEVEVDGEGGPASGGRGLFVVFEPGERHEVRARTDARLLLVLAPWPGDGHPGTRDP